MQVKISSLLDKILEKILQVCSLRSFKILAGQLFALQFVCVTFIFPYFPYFHFATAYVEVFFLEVSNL